MVFTLPVQRCATAACLASLLAAMAALHRLCAAGLAVAVALAGAGAAHAQNEPRILVTSMIGDRREVGEVNALSGRVELDPDKGPFTITLFDNRVFLSLPEPLECVSAGPTGGRYVLDSRHVELSIPEELALSVVLAREPVTLFLQPLGTGAGGLEPEYPHSCVARIVQLIAE